MSVRNPVSSAEPEPISETRKVSGESTRNHTKLVRGVSEDYVIKGPGRGNSKYHLKNLVGAAVISSLQEPTSPDFSFDEEYNTVLEYLHGFETVEAVEDKPESDKYLRAVAAKFILGDEDVTENILYDESTEEIAVTDFDEVGSKLSHQSFDSWIYNASHSVPYDLKKDEVIEEMGEVADQLSNINYEELVVQDHIPEEVVHEVRETDLLETIKENVETAQEWSV